MNIVIEENLNHTISSLVTSQLERGDVTTQLQERQEYTHYRYMYLTR